MRLQLKATLEGHEHPIYALCNSSKEHIIFSGGGEGAVVEWSLKTMQPIKIMYKTRASIYSIHCPKSLPLLVSGDREGKISIFHFVDQKLIYQEALCNKAIFGMLSIEHLLYFVSEDGILRVFNLDTLTMVSEHPISENALRCITYNESDQLLYIGCKDCIIYAFSIHEQKVKYKMQDHTLPVFSLAYDATHKHLLSGSRDAQIKIWTNSEVQNLPAHLYAVNNIQLIPSLGVFASASMDKSLKIWDAQNFRLMGLADPHVNNGHHKSVNTLCFTPYENLLVSAGDDRLIKVWRF